MSTTAAFPRKQKVVVIGGGTGTFSVLSGLKQYRDIELTAVVTMTDSGGSTGRLRDEFGMLPVGDMRLCLVALAREDEAGELLRKLFLHRFDKEKSSLHGHNFGNILLTALTDMLGSEEQAIEAAAEILNVRGRVMPVTTDHTDLVAQYENGEVLFGESEIDDPNEHTHDCTTRVTNLWTQPKAVLNPRVREAILEADFVVLGPGDLYSSLLSNVIVQGFPDALQESNAKFVYVANLVTKYGQTHGLKLSDFVSEVHKYAGRMPDMIVQNSAALPEEVLAKYKIEQSFPIVDDWQERIQADSQFAELAADVKREQAPLLAEEIYVKPSGDVLKRSLLRHDPHRLGTAIRALIWNNEATNGNSN